MNFRQIKIDEWIKDDYRPFAELKVRTSTIADKFGVVFEDSYEDGLGKTKLAGFITNFGTQFFLEEFLPKTEQSFIQIGFLNDEQTISRHLDEILEVLEVTSKHLTWFDERIKLQPCELWRQDDNGHKLLIETFPCKADAVKTMKEFEARLHKQTYWVEKII
jgi:hypothetical protein